MSNKEFNRLDLIKLVTDTYDKLSPDQRNSYRLGMELAKLKGTRLKQLVQEASIIISSYISDLLVELFYPLLLESHDNYAGVRKRCFNEFVTGVVKVS